VSSPFAIVGAGALGQSFAALLALSGQPVTLLSTKRTELRLRQAGTIQLRGAVDAVVPLERLSLTSDPSRLPPNAALIFTTKGTDLAEAIETVCSAACDRIAWAAGVQNGVLKDDLLARAFGPERVVGTATIFGATREADGGVRVWGRGGTYLGEHDCRMSERVREAAAAFEAAGIPTEARTDIKSVLWSKACNATGVFGVSVLARVSNPRLFSDRDLMRAYLALVRETAAVGEACGVKVGNIPAFPPIQSFVERDEQAILDEVRPMGPPDGPPSYASMTHDLLAGLPLEVDAIFGDVVRRADEKGLPVPCLRFARDLIRGVDPGRVAKQ
jgi:2-dehydropantoate 2-reductase